MLMSTPESDPHGFILSGVFVLMIFGIVAIICSLLFKKGLKYKIISQIIFISVAIIAYIELFTPYAGMFI